MDQPVAPTETAVLDRWLHILVERRAADLFLETARREAAGRALPALWERTDLRLARGGTGRNAAWVVGGELIEKDAEQFINEKCSPLDVTFWTD